MPRCETSDGTRSQVWSEDGLTSQNGLPCEVMHRMFAPKSRLHLSGGDPIDGLFPCSPCAPATCVTSRLACRSHIRPRLSSALRCLFRSRLRDPQPLATSRSIANIQRRAVIAATSFCDSLGMVITRLDIMYYEQAHRWAGYKFMNFSFELSVKAVSRKTPP